MYICKFCQKECNSKQSWLNHERLCKLNPNRQFTHYSNLVWQKVKGSNQFIKAKLENKVAIVTQETKDKMRLKNKGRKHTQETKDKISKKLTINNRGGRCQWIEFKGQTLQGNWELNIAKKLEEQSIKWLKIKTNKFTFKYKGDDNKVHSYTPDFYLEEFNIYLEIKGYWWGNDKRKMELVKLQNQIDNLIIIEKDVYYQIINDEISFYDLIGYQAVPVKAGV